MYKCFLKTEETLLNPKGGCMKKLLVVLMVLSIATIANAGLVISDSTPVAGTLSITGDGGTASPQPLYLVIDGGASLSGGALAGVNAWAAISDFIQADAGMVAYLNGVSGLEGVTDAIQITGVYSDPLITAYQGLIVDGVAYTLPTTGAVSVSLISIFTPFDEETGEFGTPVVTGMADPVVLQVPEPMTMGLLGLGGLFLRRRSK
jgi:hypothetical protein